MLIEDLDQYLKRARGAIHIGAHDGEERNWYREHGFAPVLYFEPNQELFGRLQQNIRSYEKHMAYNVGVHDSLQQGTLHVSSNDGMSSSLLDLKLHKTHYPRVRYVRDEIVRLVRMDAFFRDHGFFMCDFNFLAIDVQGVELNVIKSFGENIRQLDYIYTEVNIAELYSGCSLANEIDGCLENYGFVRAIDYMTKKCWGDALYVKRDLL